MNLRILLLVATASALMAASPAPQAASSPAPNQLGDLESRVRRFGAAWGKGDAATLDALLAPEYIHTDVEGHVQNRAEWLEFAKGPRDVNLGFEDLRFRLIGDGSVALVTGGNTMTDPRTHQPLALRFTQVWISTSEGWKRTAFQATPVAPGKGK